MSALVAALIGPVTLIAVVPFTVWSLYNGTYPVWQAVRASLLLGVVVLLLIGLLSWLMRSVPKAAVVATLVICGLLTLYVNSTVVLMLLGIFSLAAFVDRSQAFRNLNIAASVMGFVLLGGAAWPALQTSFEDRQLVASDDAVGAISLKQKPSIVHIVLDGYGSPEILSRIYEHDSERFFTALEQRGFVVIRKVATPYSQTLPSMASVMSGGIVDVAARVDPQVLRRDLGYTISNGPVASVLREAGYMLTRNRSGYGYLDHPDATDLTPNRIGLTELEAMLVPGNPDVFGQVHNTNLKASLKPGLLNDLDEPFFYYQHLLAPHPPFSINADGSPRPVTTASYKDGSHLLWLLEDGRADYIEGYRQKALFIENALLRQIDAYPPGPKIVLIHGDHGPAAYLDHESAERTCMSERLQTFMAFYSNVPDVSFEDLVETDYPVSTVNAYREIFGRLTTDEIPTLPAQSNYLRWSAPTKAIEVAPEGLVDDCG